MKAAATFLLAIIIASLHAQDKPLPYNEIPDYPEKYTGGAVASRMVDGLGFRYYWATDGLRDADLSYKPSPEARTSQETLQHIYDMSFIIANSTTKTPNFPQGEKTRPTFAVMRRQTLENFKTASDRLRNATEADLKEFKLIFKNNENTSEFPFWNQINGPIADCLWHVGQVVSFRRASGNPFNEKASVFTGKVRP